MTSPGSLSPPLCAFNDESLTRGSRTAHARPCTGTSWLWSASRSAAGVPSDPGASIEPSTETTVTYRDSSFAAMIRPTLSACVLVQDAAKRLANALQPALVAEERGQPERQSEHEADDRPERGGGLEAWEVNVHAEDARDQRQRQQDHGHDGQEAQDVVLAVRDDRLVRVLERLHDLLVVVEEVPDPFARVDDVVEVELELLGQEALDLALEEPQRRALRLDDLAVGDDLLFHVREVAHDLLGALLEQVVLDRIELVPDLVEDREAVVEEVVEDVVEQVPRPLREELVAKLLVLLTAAEEPRYRQELDVRQRDEVVGPDEEVELGRVQPLDVLVVDREVEDAEEVVRVVVDLRALAAREDVLEVEGMPAIALGEGRGLLQRGGVEVDPGEAVVVELGDARLRPCGGFPRLRARSRALDAGKARHRD